MGRDGTTRVLIERSFGIEQREIRLRSETCRDLKQGIYSELGISVSKQEIVSNNRPLANKEKTGDMTVTLRLKKKHAPSTK